MSNQNLICPISQEYLENPILTPCCGNAVSRDCLVEWLTHESTCPICRSNISGFDPHGHPTIKNIMDMVEEAKKNGIEMPILEESIIDNNNKWKARIHRMCGNGQSVIGKLELSNNDNSNNFKTLLIPTIDKSGSMAGGSFNQVKYSLKRIVDLTYAKPQLVTNLVSYCDRAETVAINKVLAQSYYDNIVNNMAAGGGTSFNSAFSEIIKVCNNYKDDNLVSSMVIIFLTDGMDSSCHTKQQRLELVKTLKTNIENIWKKPYTVHTIGFTGDHDHEFLNELRLIGVEGAYRYADPKEDTDCISSKINSILDVVANATSIPIKLLECEGSPKIILNENGNYWLNLTNHNMTNLPKYNLIVGDDENYEIVCEYDENENDEVVCNQWYSILIDQIANELLSLSNDNNSGLDKELHCEILGQRVRAIKSRLNPDGNNYLRLEKLVEMLNVISVGGVVDQRKLNDAKFEGQFQTKTNNTPKITCSNNYQPIITCNNNNYSSNQYWNTIKKPQISRCVSSKNSPEIFIIIGTYRSSDACDWINNNYSEEYDKNGANPLIVAASIGKIDIVKIILANMNSNDMHHKNNLGYNALDMAALFGWWITFDLLADNGLKPTINGDTLLYTCLSNEPVYTNVADRLVKHGFVSVTEDMIGGAKTNMATNWIANKSMKSVTLDVAINKGMYDEVINKLDSIEFIDLDKYVDIFTKNTYEYIKVVEILLDNKKIDVNKNIKINNNDEDEVTWPLFIACEKGNMNMVNILLKHTDVNKQNLRGTTCIWIASCNKHIEIVIKLLENNADPNIANFKGDSPLIPCCQKGAESIVELLLEKGANINLYNKNRDNPVLICCRTGQAKILELLLKQYSGDALVNILETYAEIDGFVPLLAATELDKVECIKVCMKFGANINIRTNDDNLVIPGAMAIHLAAFYGRIRALQTLCELGANMTSATSVKGMTILHIAIKQGQKDMAQYILNTPYGKQCLNIKDNDGRMPVYYAKKEGNEQIYNDFFVNKLEVIMNRVMLSGEVMESKCVDVMVKYGNSLGVYEYDNISNIMCSNGSSLLSNALLLGNKHLIDGLMKMNVDCNVKDDYGLSPMFWKVLLGYDVDVVDQNVLALVDKVNNISKSSLQNKMLLNLKVGEVFDNKPLLGNGDINLLTRMKNGYSLKVNNNTLETLKSSSKMEQSLIGFIDKLSNNKVFPEGKQYLNYIIWCSKIHLIKMISVGTELSVLHMLALYLYTGNKTIFENVNISIANWKDNNLWNPFVCCLYQAIDLLPVYEGETYRGIDIPFNLADFEIGKVLSWNTFVICSKDYSCPSELINMKMGIIFVINNKSGRDISKYSKNPVDGEVIYKPGSKMQITNYYVASVTCLGQANIRKSTYSMKENDLNKVLKGESSIIVELTEV